MPTPTYMIDKDNDKQYRLNGYKPSKRLPKKENLRKQFRDVMQFTSEDELPKGGVDLRDLMPDVQCQSKIASCTANAIAGIYGYLLRAENPGDNDVSRLFVYYNARLKKKMKKMKDSGTSMTNTIEALEEQGACHDEFWPYDITKVDERPNNEAYEEGKKHTISEAFQVKSELFEMKACLAQGLPFAFGITLHQSFDQAKVKGVVPMPKPGEPTRKSHAAHAILAVGYVEKEQVFIARNSWSAGWGDKGYCYIPYKYMTDKYRCFDMWTVRRLNTENLNRKGWKEEANWCPCEFSYEEELHRIEEIHCVEEEVFVEIAGIGDDDDEEVASSAEFSDNEDESSGDGGGHENEPTSPAHHEEEPVSSSIQDEPEQHEESASAGEMMSPSEPADGGEQQCDNQQAESGQPEDEE